MKPSLSVCLVLLLFLLLLLGACSDSDNIIRIRVTGGSADPTVSTPFETVIPTDQTTALVPETSAPQTSDTQTSSTELSDIDSSPVVPATTPTVPTGTVTSDLPTTAPPVTTTPAVTTTTKPVTTTTKPVTTTTKPVTTTTKPVTTTTKPVTTTTKPVTTTTKPVTTTTAPVTIAPEVHWVVECNNSVSLRKEASTAASTITTIKKGESVELIEFTGKFAKVKYKNKTGFILASYVTRPDGLGTESDLTVVEFVEKYSYDQMQTDLAILAERFPDRMTLSSIGKSEEGRDLSLVILGNPNAQYKIFMQASIHGREHVVSQIAMGEIDYILHHWDMELENGMTVGELLDLVSIHIVPMSNPDGVTISQSGTLPPPFSDQYTADKATLWKANANGIDLNANFDALWEKYDSDYHSTAPAYAGYKGTSPECAAESKALGDYLRSTNFAATLSYHSSGSLIYWSFNYDALKQVNDQSKSLGTAISKVTGYGLSQQTSKSTAGLKDYAMMALGIPSLTIEFAIEDAPAPLREYEQLWERGKLTLLTTAQWVLSN